MTTQTSIKRQQATAVVGIAVSKPYIEQLKRFLGKIPWDSKLAFLLLPLDGLQQKELHDHLAEGTPLNTSLIESATELAGRTLHVLPDQHGVELADLTLSPTGQPLNLDTFVRTLAVSMGTKAVVVMLTHASGSGLEGLKDLLGAGGISLHLQPASDQSYEEVFYTALNTLSDAVNTPEQLATRLLAYTDRQKSEHFLLPDQPDQETLEALTQVFRITKSTTGNDYFEYTPEVTYPCIRQRLLIHKLDNIHEYVGLLKTSPDEAVQLSKRFLYRRGTFFHDMDLLATMAEHIRMRVEQPDVGQRLVRIWVPATGMGEAAYGLAMYLKHTLGQQGVTPPFQIIATEVDEELLALARTGRYGAGITDNVPQEYLEAYFREENGTYQVSGEIRKLIHFFAHDPTLPPPVSSLSLIYSPDAAARYRPEIQQQVILHFRMALQPNGILAFGISNLPDTMNLPFSRSKDDDRILNPTNQGDKQPEKQQKIALFKSEETPSEPAAAMSEEPNTPQDSPATPPPLPGATPATPPPLPNQVATPAPKPVMPPPPIVSTTLPLFHQQLLLRYHTPVSIVVDESLRLVDMHGKTAAFFKDPELGKLVLDCISPDLLESVQTGLTRVFEEQKSISPQVLSLERSGKMRWVKLKIRPLRLPETHERGVQVTFQPIDPPAQAAPKSETNGHAPQGLVDTGASEAQLRELKAAFDQRQQQLADANQALQQELNLLKQQSSSMQGATSEQQQKAEELSRANQELLALNQALTQKLEAQNIKQQFNTAGATNGHLAEHGQMTAERSTLIAALTSIIGYAELLSERVNNTERDLVRMITESGNQLNTLLTQLMPAAGPDEAVQSARHVFKEPDQGRILIAEDNLDTRRLLELIFSTAYPCAVYSNAKDAIDAAHAEPFKAVLLDVHLGNDETGVDVLQNLQAIPHYRNVPFMAITGLSSTEDRQMLKDAGFWACISKPFSKQKLLDTLEELLKQTPAHV